MQKLQILGILLFIIGNIFGKSLIPSNLIPFLIACLTGLKPNLQGKN